MIVGGVATCPKCQRNDSTQRVALIVKQAEGNLSPGEMDSLMNQVMGGGAQEWSTPIGESTWKQLGEKLRFRDAPRLAWWVNPSSTTTRYVGFLVIGLGIGLVYLAVQYLPPSVPIWVGILILLLPLGLLAWLWSFGANGARKAHVAEIDKWSKESVNWSRIWYCARDNVVFVPADTRTVSPDQITTLIHPTGK